LDSFPSQNDTSLSIGSLDDGAIESTWEAHCPSSALLIKFISPSLIAYGDFGPKIHFWDLHEKKFIGEIEYGQGDEVDGIFEWGEFGKYFIFGTSEGGLTILKLGDMTGGYVAEEKFGKEDVVYIFEISPNFLQIFDRGSFYFLDLDTMKLVVPPYPTLIFPDGLRDVYKLSNENFFINNGKDP
jgi:hypothetical protein